MVQDRRGGEPGQCRSGAYSMAVALKEGCCGLFAVAALFAIRSVT